MRVATVTLTLVIAGSLHVSPASAGATAPSCRGQVATILVPDADGIYQGTDGPDVIVAERPDTAVYAYGGNDLVCVDRATGTRVDAGAGDDRVYVRDRSAYRHFMVESLGPGDDAFVGGPGVDWVFGAFDDVPRFDQGHDHIATRGGNDLVVVGTVGVDAHHVDLDLGVGDDTVDVLGDGVTPDSTLNGGDGRDRLGLKSTDDGVDVVFDARSHTVDRGGRIVSSWTSFERYRVHEYRAMVVFEGTAGPDDVAISADVVDATLGGGRDVVELGADGGVVRGGPGRDKVVDTEARGFAGAHVDLARREIRHESGRVAITSFQDATSMFGRVTGNAEANILVLGGCGTVRAGAGDDKVRQVSPFRPRHPGRCEDFAAYGGPGADVLSGSQGPDRLVGGTGRDVAYGKKGRDVCLVERAYGC